MKENNQLNGRLIIALGRAFQSIHRRSEVLFRQNNLTMAQFTVLEALYHKGDLTVGGLIASVLSTSGNMTVVVRNLERDGLVCRRENPADGRSFLISLTDRGRALIAQVYLRHMELVEESITPLSGEEKETVIHILRKLIKE